ncbi:MAG: DmsC/YnfH family molybdoenzyme membrane anchor subunit, partial [Acidobacteriota bacterium]
FCGHRQAEGLQPACVEQCPTGALGFGPMDELSPIEEGVGLPTLAPGPAIRFVPWRRSVVETGGTPQNGATAETDQATRKISLRKEWPLVAFTWIAALLVAAFVADAAGSPWFELSPWAFFSLAALGMGASTAHLGKPLRAWRALLNWRHSWLSREIALFSAFAGLATLDFLMPTTPWLAPAAGFCGLAALYAIDRVYDLVRPPEARLLHSADVVLTGALLTALLLGKPWATGAVALIELVLYLWRKVLRRQRGKTVRWAWSAARLGLGFAVPLGLALTGAQHWTAWALVSVLLGELIDRCEFYEELEVPTPRGQMDHELAARLQRPAA